MQGSFWNNKSNQRGKSNPRVFVGVSGGVDSSVAAAMLLEQGYEVWGVFIRTWQPDWMECTWRQERRDAMRVCAHLNIPFLECDLEEEYKKGVADYMIDEYKKGRTPNPDVMCNKVVKFGGFLKFALKRGADYVATGHYARVAGENLLRGIDPAKDQSYFLWTLTQQQLQHVLFPVGHLPKSEVRKLAHKFGLPTATKKDSQGICFIGDISMKEFLSHYIPSQRGDVVNEQGEVIGYHDGALFFTMGERHGFIITEKGTDDGPMYVVNKNIEKNTITVISHPRVARELPSKEVSKSSIQLYEVNDISHIFKGGMRCQCQIRYHGEIKQCTVVNYDPEQKTMVIQLAEPDRTISSGQSLVVYDGEVCLGGGIIV